MNEEEHRKISEQGMKMREELAEAFAVTASNRYGSYCDKIEQVILSVENTTEADRNKLREELAVIVGDMSLELFGLGWHAFRLKQ